MLVAPNLARYTDRAIGATELGHTPTAGVWQFNSTRPGPSVLITALIHGNEICGAWAASQLIEELWQSAIAVEQGQLTIAFCNLKAFEQFNPNDLHSSRFVDEDMNRVWSDDKLYNATSYERQRANELLPFVNQADYLLDLHSMHDPGEPLLLTGLLARHFEFAQSLHLPGHIIVDAGHSEGVRLRDYNTKTTALLVECGFHLEPHSLVMAKHAIAAFLEATKIVSNGAVFSGAFLKGCKQVKPLAAAAVKVTHAVVAQSSHLVFTNEWHNMQLIAQAGTVIATEGGSEHVTPYNNCTLIMPSLKQLRAGVTVVRFAQNCVPTVR